MYDYQPTNELVESHHTYTMTKSKKKNNNNNYFKFLTEIIAVRRVVCAQNRAESYQSMNRAPAIGAAM